MATLNPPSPSSSPRVTRLYVTRWVLSRGILVMQGHLHRRKGEAGAQKDWYLLEKPYRDSFRHSQVALGNEAFLTLSEAMTNAKFRFADAKAIYQTRVNELVRANQQVGAGKLKVHDLTTFEREFAISHLRAFESRPRGSEPP